MLVGMYDDDEIEMDEQETDAGQGSDSRRVRDAFAKAVTQGIRQVRTGEGRIRGLLNEAMPREVVTYFKGAIDGAREEVVRVIGTQTRRFLEGIDVGGEIAKILTTLSFEIRTEIRFIPNDQKVKPSIRTKIRPKVNRPAGEEDGPEEDEEG